MPMSAAGVLLALLVVAMVGHAASLQHQQSMNTADDISASEVRGLYGEVETNISCLLRDSIYRSLWEVSKNADMYSNVYTREHAVEEIASEYFKERLRELSEKYPAHESGIELCVTDNCVHLTLQEVEDGYVLATAELPEGSAVNLTSSNGKLSVKVPLEETRAFVDSRYFLLQERMDEFVQRRGDIGRFWKEMEYIWAWGEAWLEGNVNLSEDRTKGFFQVAWAMHELDSFGSADYLTAAQALVGMETPATEPLVVTPINTVDIERLDGYVDRARDSINCAKALLEMADENISLAKNFANENLENVGLGKIRVALNDSESNACDARDKIMEASAQFSGLLDYLSRESSGDVVMASVYQGLTTRSLDPDCPSLKEQVECGIEGAAEKISAVENLIARTAGGLEVAAAKSSLNQLSTDFRNMKAPLLEEPGPKRYVYVEAYEDDPPREVQRPIPVYIDCKADGSIGGLKVVLRGAKSGFEEMNEFSQQSENDPPSLDIDEDLKNALQQNLLPTWSDRENIYEILPPSPIKSSPGLSVYHELSVDEVKYTREDLVGLLLNSATDSSPATPFPIPFIGITLWWGQWDAEVKLERRPVEEVFDFDNPTLPLANGAGYVHSSLAYRWDVPDETFDARVIVVSTKAFTISTG